MLSIAINNRQMTGTLPGHYSSERFGGTGVDGMISVRLIAPAACVVALNLLDRDKHGRDDTTLSHDQAYKAVEGITASQAHQRYVNAHLEHARRGLLHILKSVQSHRLSLSLTSLRSVWLKIFYHTSDGHDTLRKVSQISSDITRLLSGNALCTIERYFLSPHDIFHFILK